MQQIECVMLERAAREVDQAILDQLPDPKECKHEFSPEFERKMMELMKLRPSYHGKDCPGSGEHPDIEIQCDECDHYLECFPDWRDFL